MTTYEDVQRGISEDLETHAGMAIKWASLAAGDKSGPAKGMADKSYKAFSTFLLEEHIAHGGKDLPTNSSLPVHSEINENISEINGILTQYVGSAEEALSKRQRIMKFLNENSHMYSLRNGFDSETKILNSLAKLKPEPTGNERQIAYTKERDGGNFKYTDNLFKPAIAQELLSRTRGIKASSLSYISGRDVSASHELESVVEPPHGLRLGRETSAPHEADGPLDIKTFMKEKLGLDGAKLLKTLNSDKLAKVLPKVKRHYGLGRAQSSHPAPGAPTIAPPSLKDSNNRKRGAAELSDDGISNTQSNKRQEIFKGRPGRSSPGRDI